MNDELGKFIVKMIGDDEISYVGLQDNHLGEIVTMLFNDLQTRTTFAGKSLRDTIKALSNSRGRFGSSYTYSLFAEV